MTQARGEVTEGNWQEFLAECSMIQQYKNSDAVLIQNRKAFQAKLKREKQERDREAEILRIETEWQEAHRDEIAAQNRAVGDRIREHACKHCFCVHPGEC